MTVVLTIRDVPDEVRDLLAQEARERGQSLQSFLLYVLRRQADYGLNRQILVEIDKDLLAGGAAGHQTRDAAGLLTDARQGSKPSHAGDSP
jgi:hypothetical protein